MTRDVPPEPERSLLVVIGSTCEADKLAEELRRQSEDGPPAIHVLAPALTETPFEHAAGDVDDAIEVAKRRVEDTVAGLRSSFPRVTGGIGDSDPLLAIGDALRTAEFERVVIVTSEDDAWLEEDAFNRARTELDRPLTHLELSAEGGVVEKEASPPGRDPKSEAEVEVPTATGTFGRITTRDLLGITIAIVGTLALIILAANCLGSGSIGAACVARTLLAGGIALINVAHVIGLTMFAAADYQGPPERFFALTSAWGTPIAVVISFALPA